MAEVLTSFTRNTLVIRQGHGSGRSVLLQDTSCVFVGKEVGRADAKSLQVIGVTAVNVRINGDAYLVGHYFFMSDDVGSLQRRRLLARLFLDKELPGSPGHFGRQQIVGEFLELQRGQVLVLRTWQGPVSIKLDPEANGFRPRPGDRRDIVVGAHVVVVTSGAQQCVLVMRSAD